MVLNPFGLICICTYLSIVNVGSIVIECYQTSSCAQASLICPQTSDCHLKCIASKACWRTQVVWPINGTGSIECNGYMACAGVNFPRPPPNDNYVIECGGLLQCAGAYIICPESADCHLKCDGDTACMSPHIVWPIDGRGSIECNGYDACENVTFPLPPSDESYVVECRDTKSCRNARIICPQNTDCTLKCNGTMACYGATIVLPINGTATVECHGDTACHRLQPIASKASDPDVSNANYIVECTDCSRSTVNCPVDANCTVKCISGSSCNLATVNWPSGFVKSELICLSQTACQSANPQPPNQYDYHFDKTYDVSQNVSETLQITEEFHIAFAMKIDSLAQGSTYSLISIQNGDTTAFKLWLHTDRDPNLFEIEFDNEDIVFFLGSDNINDQSYHCFIVNKT
eukprot:705564_1